MSSRKFYYADNASKPVGNKDLKVAFEPLELFGGAIPGAYSTESADEQKVLDEVASNPASAVREIDETEWEKLTKKKAPVPNTIISAPLKETSQGVPLSPTPSRKPAEVVEEPVKSASEKVGTPTQIKDIHEVLKEGKVAPVPHTASESPKHKNK